MLFFFSPTQRICIGHLSMNIFYLQNFHLHHVFLGQHSLVYKTRVSRFSFPRMVFLGSTQRYEEEVVGFFLNLDLI